MGELSNNEKRLVGVYGKVESCLSFLMIISTESNMQGCDCLIISIHNCTAHLLPTTEIARSILSPQKFQNLLIAYTGVNDN